MGAWFSFLGLVAAVMLLFGVSEALIARSFNSALVLVHLIAGGVLGAAWFLRRGIYEVKNARRIVQGKVVRYGYNCALYAAVFAGLLICANWLARIHDRRWDLTEQGVHSLSGQSVDLIRGLEQPLELAVMDSPGVVSRAEADRLLGLYRFHNPRMVSVEFVDARLYPDRVDQEFGMKPGNVLYVKYGVGLQAKIARLNKISEEMLTNAVLKLARGRPRAIYYVMGHDEPELSGAGDRDLGELAAALAAESISVTGMVLADQTRVPEDAAAIMLVSPRKELLAREKLLLEGYADRGGSLLILHDPLSGAAAAELAAHFGIEIGKNVVVDQVRRLHGAPELGWQIVVQEYGRHRITRDFTGKDATVYLIASALALQSAAPAWGACTELVRSSPSAWAETDLKMLLGAESRANFDAGRDLKGPLALAVVCERPVLEGGAGRGRVAVFGDSEWVKNVNLNVYANRDLILNSMNWLVGEEAGISIRPGSMRESRAAALSHADFVLILVSSMVVPELILIFGLAVWWKRRAAWR
jgi:hypothetical protein